MKFLELKEKYGIVMLDRFFADPVEMQCRETGLLKLVLDLYHNEVDAHYNIEQFLKSNYEGKYALPDRLTKEERGFTENYEAFSNLKTGTWIRFYTWQIENHTYMIDRNYINFAGETGTIVQNDLKYLGISETGETRQFISLKLDKHFPALDDFDNCLSWEIEERLRFDDDDALFVECDELIPSFDILEDSGKTIDGIGYGIKPKEVI